MIGRRGFFGGLVGSVLSGCRIKPKRQPRPTRLSALGQIRCMTPEQAVEVLNRYEHGGLRWRLAQPFDGIPVNPFWGRWARGDDGHLPSEERGRGSYFTTRSLAEFELIAIAQRYEHQHLFDSRDLNPYRAGDAVILNSGGPVMTVEAIKGDELFCSWKGPNGRDSHQFPFQCVYRQGATS